MLDKIYTVEDSSLFWYAFLCLISTSAPSILDDYNANFEPENPKNNKTNTNIELINK